MRHALRFYARHGADLGGTPTFRRESDRLNWTACDVALRSVPDNERFVLLRVYKLDCGSVDEAVATTARDFGLQRDALWRLVRGVERLVAVHRGLI